MKHLFARRVGVAVLGVGLAAGLAVSTPSAADPGGLIIDVAVPDATGPIPTTANSRPFIDRMGPPRKAANEADYKELELFVSGDANVYSWDGEDPVIRTAGAPYETRIVVRTPSDASQFSGTVWVEPLNPTLAIDLDRMWQLHYDQIINDGDAWVGITSKPITIQALKRFDPDRYASLAMDNPLPPEEQTCGTIPGEDGYNENSSKLYENGLIWDIMSQVGALMRSDSPTNPLPSPADTVFGEGWSQTGGFAARYLNTFGDISKFHGDPIYDGWLLGGPTGPSRINQCDSGGPSVIRSTTVPVIMLRTESDFFSFNYRRDDSSADDDRFRLYEMAGTSHDSASIYENFVPDADASAAGITPVTTAVCGFEGTQTANDLPYEYFFNAAAVNLKKWTQGIEPPHAGRFVYDGLNIARDNFGNAIGGLRSPYVDIPTATYGLPPGRACPYIGTKTPFDEDLLESLYPSRNKYLTHVAAQADRMVRDGFLLQADADKITQEAEQIALPENPAPEPQPTETVTTPGGTGGSDLYDTPGFHNVGGRKWMTVCEPYSATRRCYTYIWGTTIQAYGNSYAQVNGWLFNNLTYAASPKRIWRGNPLAANGSWTSDEGRTWRTECDTAASGRNGCRNYVVATVIERSGDAYRVVTKEVFNSQVRFA